MSGAMQGRLLSRLHRVFDHRPGAVLALRVRSPGGLRWQIADDTLAVARPGLPDMLVPLAGRTVGAVRGELAAAGIDIAYADPSLDRIGALALLAGAGDQESSNGDHLFIATSLLWGWTDALGRVLDRAKADVVEALRQLTIPTAEGEWLDIWGSYFGIGRRDGEEDPSLAERIVWEPRRPRSNPVAMQANIKRLTGMDVEVREPWRELFTAGVSELSGSDHLPDDKEYGYHRIQLVARRPIDFTGPMREAELDRPAGTLLLPPAIILPPSLVHAGAGAAVDFGGHDTWSFHVHDFDGMILDYNFVLGDSFVKLNPSLAVTSVYSGFAPGLPDQQDIGRPLTFCRGEMILSEQGPLDEEQSHLPGRELVEIGAPMVLSDSGALSDYDWALAWWPIDEWIHATAGSAPEPFSYPPSESCGVHSVYSAIAQAGESVTTSGSATVTALPMPTVYGGGGWRGRWDARRWSDVNYPPPTASCGYSTTT